MHKYEWCIITNGAVGVRWALVVGAVGARGKCSGRSVSAVGARGAQWALVVGAVGARGKRSGRSVGAVGTQSGQVPLRGSEWCHESGHTVGVRIFKRLVS